MRRLPEGGMSDHTRDSPSWNSFLDISEMKGMTEMKTL